MTEEKLLTTEELAEMFSMKVETLRNWRSQNKGPKYIKIGGSVRYKLSDVNQYLKNNTK